MVKVDTEALVLEILLTENFDYELLVTASAASDSDFTLNSAGSANVWIVNEDSELSGFKEAYTRPNRRAST